MHYVYLLFNDKTQRYYIGYSPNLKNRVKKHLEGKVKSTKSDLNYMLVWYCGFINKQDALRFERYLKSGSGVAFMRKRLLSKNVAIAKDNIANWD